MEKCDFKEIMNHYIDDKVLTLIKQVISYYPNKKLLVHPISLAQKELKVTINININGMAKPSLNKYIGIWINENLSTSEFNIILAEELYHHIQAYIEYPHIFGLYDNEFSSYFSKSLTSIIWDIDAHYYLMGKGFDLAPIQNLDYNEALVTIKGVTREQLKQFSQPNQNYIFFPQYLLWWYDLVFLPSPFKEKWDADINQWFLKHIPFTTQKTWSSLIQFIKENPISSSYSVKTSMTEICRKLTKQMPVFKPALTEGLDIDLVLKELVPR
jgi:hypothetical protein